MDSAFAWQQLFENWPSHIARKGLVITTTGESISFSRFLVMDGILALERDRPDSLGARKVIISFSGITAVKMTDAGDFLELREMGFREAGGP